MKITIITVCYNSGKTIERTIKSVICQQCTNLEYIIIDGASEDNTCEIIQKYEKEISCWISEADEGIYDAMNKGVKLSTGDIIAFLNSDDWYGENTLKCVEKYFRENDVDMLCGSICFVRGEKANIVNSKKQENSDDYFFNIDFPHPSLFVKADLFEQYGLFDIQYKIAADYDWMLRVCLAGVKVMTVTECFTYFSYGGVSTLRTYDARKEQYQSALCSMDHYGKEYLRKRLQEHYTKELEYIKRENNVYRMKKQHLELIKSLVEADKAYYIWGVGARGKQCMDLFELAGINIVGFVDSYADITEFREYRVLRPNRIGKNSYICVTPKQYEMEIMSQLKEKEIDEKQIILFSCILDILSSVR